MSYLDPKKRKLNDFISSWSECCICGERGSLGMTNVFNLSLRENEIVVKPFSEILEFALGLKIQVGASDICSNCKQKSIEFYHFKRRSHVKNKPLTIMNTALPPNISSLAQDSIRIVDMYIKKFSIKALRIEESDEKLIIMKKPPNVKLLETPPTATLAENASPCASPQIKQEPLDEEESQSGLLQVKQEPMSDECINIKIEPDLIIEDIGDDSMDSPAMNSPAPASAPTNNESNEASPQNESNSNQLDTLVSMNQQIFSLVQDLNSKVESLGRNFGRVEKMYETEGSEEECEPSGTPVMLPENLKCENLPDVLFFNRILQHRENQEKLEMILKQKLGAFNDNYKLLLKEGLNILMSKPTQYLINHDGQSVLKTSRAVKCLLKITHEIFGTPIQHIERYVYHQLFMKKAIVAWT